MDMQTQLRQQVDSHSVVLYMKGTPQFPQCGFSGNAARILKAIVGNDFLAVDLIQNSELIQPLREFANWPTTPLLFVHGEFIGGSDIMTEMFQAGELQALIAGKD
jgi:monothiol glutaredoxin